MYVCNSQELNKPLAQEPMKLETLDPEPEAGYCTLYFRLNYDCSALMAVGSSAGDKVVKSGESPNNMSLSHCLSL